MAKLVNEKQYIPFVKGLITEASPLTYPEGATLDEDNVIINRDGSRQRRKGLEVDPDATWISITGDYSISSYYEWPLAGGGDVTLGIVRIDTKLYFMDMTSDSPTLNLKNGGTAIELVEISGNKIDVAVVNNSIVLVCETLDNPLLFEYDYLTDAVSYSEIQLKVRDFWGADDGLDLNERPLTLSATHKYNLQNQGWIDTIETTCGTEPIQCTYTTKGKYPSNSDIWTFGKVANASSASYQKYSPVELFKNSQDWMQAPKGKYIIDIYNRGASRTEESSVIDLPQDSEQGRISTVATFAGRLFYSGIQSSVSGPDENSPNYSGYVFFTQTITNKSKLGACYQEADPTSEIPDIIDTDGGTVHLPEAQKILKLVPVKSSLIVFAENGIWEIYAGDTGFKASEYQLSKISNIGIINKDTVIVANDKIIFWSKFGIYLLAQEQISSRYQAQNISLTTIQTFYLNISEQAKKNAKGFYEEQQGRVRWLYSDIVDSNYPNKYDKELILDLTLQAFYPQSFSKNNQWITDYIQIPSFIINTDLDTVYVGTSIITVGSETVFSYSDTYTSRDARFNFLTISPTDGFSISGYTGTDFLDWGTDDYDSYLVTGYELFGDFMRRKQTPYLLIHFKKTETGFDVNMDLENPSSCFIQSQWNWTNSGTSGKWGVPFQAYRFSRNYIPSGPLDNFDTGDLVITTKNRLRGSGKSLSLKLYSETGKDFHIYGWGINMAGNSRV